MVPRPPLRIAVLGTAHLHVLDHLEALAADSGAELAAVWEGSPARRHPTPARLSAPSVAAALGGADAALICSTTHEHDALVRQVLAAELPALVEKPLAATTGGTAALADLLRTARAPVATAMFLRCSPALRRARAVLDSGRLGELVAADAGFSHPGLIDGIFDGPAAWMLDPAHGGTGAFADLGIHLVDLLCWLRPAAGIAVRGASLSRRPGLPVDTGGAAVLDWGGTLTTLQTGWSARPGGIHLHLEGTRGSVTVRDGDVSVQIDEEQSIEAYQPPRAADVLPAFLAGLRGERLWRAPTTDELLCCARVLDEIGRIADLAPG